MTFGHGRKLLPVTVKKFRKVVYCTYPNDNNTRLSTCTVFLCNIATHFSTYLVHASISKHNNTHQCSAPRIDAPTQSLKRSIVPQKCSAPALSPHDSAFDRSKQYLCCTISMLKSHNTMTFSHQKNLHSGTTTVCEI